MLWSRDKIKVHNLQRIAHPKSTAMEIKIVDRQLLLELSGIQGWEFRLLWNPWVMVPCSDVIDVPIFYLPLSAGFLHSDLKTVTSDT
jgi:hypothetical protein